MEAYSIYSRFYDTVEGTQKEKAEFIRDLISEYNPDTKSLLEIATGTGNILVELADLYEHIEGLDISKEMIDIAKSKLPETNLHIADMRSFSLESKFDAIICIYDSLNHLTNISEWEQTFETVSNHLKDEGLFIFDLNTEFRLLVIEDLSPYVVEFGENYMIMEVRRDTEEIYTNTLKIFEKKANDSYTLHTETIQEATFPFEKVESLLDKHFEIMTVRTFDANDNSDIPPHKFIVCKKRK